MEWNRWKRRPRQRSLTIDYTRVVFDGKAEDSDGKTEAGTRTISRRVHRFPAARHTYVTLSRDNGANGKILADRVGHASEVVTNQVYSHRTSGHDREIAEWMASLITEKLRDVMRNTLRVVA